METSLIQSEGDFFCKQAISFGMDIPIKFKAAVCTEV
jgi:hypothetical protein